jgi:hypothetical protein
MKKNTQLRSAFKLAAVAVVALVLGSCGGYYYADGVYGDREPERVMVVDRRYDEAPQPVENRYTPNRYKDYFGEKARQYSAVRDTSFTHFTDVNTYSSQQYSREGNRYGGWGSQPSNVNVNVYNNGWYDPYWGYSSYWGYDPYWGYDSYWGNYYRPYRSGWSWSFGWNSHYGSYWNGYYSYAPYYRGYYNPYWGYDPYWGGYYYPYGGYYGYYPYYRGYYYDYYPRDYYYAPRGSYDRDRDRDDREYYRRYYGNGGRAIIRENDRRGDSDRYQNYERTGDTRSYQRRDYNQSQNNSYNGYNNDYNNNNTQRSYNQGNYNERSYNSGGYERRDYNSGNSGSGNSGRGGGGGYTSPNRM